MSSSVGERIEQAYAELRLQNQRERERRLQQIYREIPVVQQLDEQITACNMQMIQSLFSREQGGDDPRQTLQDLLKKRRACLEEHGLEATYTDPLYTCAACQDTGWIRTQPCRCYRKQKTKFLYELANLSPVMEQQTFDAFCLERYSDQGEGEGLSARARMQLVRNACRDFVDKQEYQSGKNLFLYGPTGTGKTFLCSCMAHALVEQEVSVLYQSAYKIFSFMEECKFKYREEGTKEKILDQFYEVPVLMIDDLGTEFLSSFSASALFDLLNTRLLEKRSTIISTNLSLDEVGKVYSPRIQSRIFGDFHLLPCAGQDLRKKKLMGE